MTSGATPSCQRSARRAAQQSPCTLSVTSSRHSRSRSGHSKSDRRQGDRAGGRLDQIHEEKVEQNAIQPANPPVNNSANPLGNSNANPSANPPVNVNANDDANNGCQHENNINHHHGGRNRAEDHGRLERQRDLRAEQRELCQNRDMRVDLNKRHNKRDENKLRRRAEVRSRL